MADDSTTPAAGWLLPRHALRFGGVAGVLGGLWLAAQFAFGFYGRGAMLAGMAVPIAAIILGVMRWRDRVTHGRTRFSAVFGAGLAVGLAYALVAAGVIWLYASVQAEPVREQVAELYADYLQQTGTPADEIPAALETMRASLTPGLVARQTLINSLVVSLVVALIAAIVIPRQRI